MSDKTVRRRLLSCSYLTFLLSGNSDCQRDEHGGGCRSGSIVSAKTRLCDVVLTVCRYKSVMDGTLLTALKRAEVEHSRFLSEYLFCLSVCHSVSIGEVISDAEVAEKRRSPWKHLFTKMSNRVVKAFTRKEVEKVGEEDRREKSQRVELDEYRSGKWKDIIYKGSSPDEEAFVKFTLKNGFVFSSRVRDEVDVTVEIDVDHPDVHTFQVVSNFALF